MPSTTSYAPGEFVLLAFPFTTGGQAKNRPALVIVDTADSDLVAARVTTQLHQTPFDVALVDWRASGLLAPSVVRLHKLATISKSLVLKSLGVIQPGDRQTVSAVLQQLFGNW